MNLRIPASNLLALCLLFSCTLVLAQDDYDPRTPPEGEKPDTVRFFLAPPPPPVTSRYRFLEVLDQREDTMTIGLLTTNTYFDQRVIAGRPMREQLSGLFKGMIDGKARQGTLMMRVERFTLFDVESTFGRKTFIRLRLGFFSFDRDYHALYRVDTLLDMSHNILQGRFRQRLFAAASGVFSTALAHAMQLEPAVGAASYTSTEMQDYDRVYRCRLPLFQADTLASGVYLSYSAFAAQRPDYSKTIVTFDTDGRVLTLLAATPTERSAQLTPKQVYAFVWQGRAYVSQQAQFYPLIRQNGDLVYTGRIQVDNAGAAAASNIAGWALTVARRGRLPIVFVWGIARKKKMLMKLDCENGQFLPEKAAD